MRNSRPGGEGDLPTKPTNWWFIYAVVRRKPEDADAVEALRNEVKELKAEIQRLKGAEEAPPPYAYDDETRPPVEVVQSSACAAAARPKAAPRQVLAAKPPGTFNDVEMAAWLGETDAQYAFFSMCFCIVYFFVFRFLFLETVKNQH